MQPDLQTPRLSMRPVQPGDCDALWALWVQPQVRRYLWDDRVLTREQAAATLADSLELAPSGLGLWIVQREATPHAATSPAAPKAACAGAALIGCAGLLPASAATAWGEARQARSVEPVVALVPGVWGQGYAGEVLAALLDHASRTLGIERIVATVDAPNVASDRMLRRAGFTLLDERAGPQGLLRTYSLPLAGGATTAAASGRG